MPWRVAQPGVLGLRFGQFGGLRTTIHPRPTAAVLAALFQPGVPHHPTHTRDPLGEVRLFISELNSKTATCQHDSTVLRGFAK